MALANIVVPKWSDVVDTVHELETATDSLGYGSIYIAAADAAAEAIGGTADYYELATAAWTIGDEIHNMDESAGNGRLTYTGTPMVLAHVSCMFSCTAASNNQFTHWRLGKNGNTIASSEIQRKIANGADVGAGGVGDLIRMNTGDYLSLWVRNATSAANITPEVASLVATLRPLGP